MITCYLELAFQCPRVKQWTCHRNGNEFEITQRVYAQGLAGMCEDRDAVVVSSEAKAQRRAHDLNRYCHDSGLPPLEIHTLPFIIAEDGTRISSTRIRNGEIDVHGRLLDSSGLARCRWMPGKDALQDWRRWRAIRAGA
ncbi:phosphopantetheine adenylyltransferase [Halococcus thailandensis JCM 13552]|uniref:Phosphopantetheine adenylyltransferase n=1 Tax=Halococcus thailandensis JCM 13552 TaxID=1227457 RepID=M0NG77_9EURY|nr:phosphopantetheine adenylyltransferase [Halococcus thailandensis JCM 13552]